MKFSQGSGQLRDICFDSFAVWHSGESKTPIVIIERMNRARLIDAQDEDRTDRFYEEARLPFAHRARLEDYRGSGFDRGHMAPAADMPTPEAMTQSFSLANMTPQEPAVNRNLWSRNVKRATRKYVMRATGDVYVYTGVVFSEPVKTIGQGRVWVPISVQAFFNLVGRPCVLK
ncbi:DNA/RNA non-specific endonuclease [Halochromatium salexigens]|uniref:DNA/RNA non-specific endonuclease n=1 Tax=Halochromatium salexigens TaxID=49447 RepID=UPI001911D176